MPKHGNSPGDWKQQCSAPLFGDNLERTLSLTFASLSGGDCLLRRRNPNLCTELSRRYERRRSLLHVLALPEQHRTNFPSALGKEGTTFPFQSPGEKRRGREIPRDKSAQENPPYNCPKQNTHISLLFAGNLLDDEVALDWITTQATSESVEEVTPIVLSKLVGDARRLAVLFCE